jgi:kynureninase
MTTHEADGSAYLVYHSIGMYPGKAGEMAAALSDFAAGWGAHDDGQWMRALSIRQRFVELWSGLIGAPAGTLTTTENVTTALSSLMGALPAHHLRGRKVLIGGDCFPSMHFLLTGLADRLGFTLDTVPIRQGESWVRDEDFLDRWTPEVGLALVTWITSTSSHRCDLRRVVEHGRAQGSLIGVDVTQGVGLFDFDVSDPAIDFTISTSLKWLCGTPGAGILHVDEGLIAQCRPELRGWFSQENIFSWDLDKFAYAADVRRFDHGTPSIVACAGTVPALEWHARQDMAAMRDHNRSLSARLIEVADALELPLVSPRDENERGGSVMVRLPQRSEPQAVLAGLREARVFADCRGHTLRLSPGTITTAEGIERAAAALASALGRS